MKKLIAISLSLVFLIGATGVASAQTTNTTSATDQIKTLLQQVKNLQEQIAVLNKQKGQLTSELQTTLKLTRSLTLGMSGEEVKILQGILAVDTEVYPEGLTTGFFGALTEKAVKRFQKKYDIEQMGNVGPKTLKKLNEWSKEHGKKSDDDDDDNDDDDYKKMNRATSTATTTSALSSFKVTICHKEEKKSGGNTITIGLPALGAHLKHGDRVGACNSVVTPPSTSTTTDTVAPSISSVATSMIKATTTTISWNTNEMATSTLWYSTTTPIDMNTALKLGNTTLKTTHSYDLTGLSATTTYYYLIRVSDASFNTTTSSQYSFTTIE